VRAALLSNVSYDIALSLSDEPDVETFESATTIVFDVAIGGSETFVNLVARSIDECRLNGTRLSAVEYGFDGARLRLSRLRSGPNRLFVAAQCEYQHTGVGLHRFRDPIDGDVYVYTLMAPFDAHKVVACFDQPDLKARVSLAVSAPKAWQVCANGSLVRSEVRGDTKTWHFKTTPPLPPYLIAVAAGGFHTVKRTHHDTPMALWCRASLAEWLDAQAEEIFEITASGLDFFAEYFGFAYPFDEYNQLFVPEFNAGAMENPGCVSFNEAYIHRGRASEAELERRAATILHEMAHVHGFGDVATMRWWSDLWLNETFATYVANLALEKGSRFTNPWINFANSTKSIAARQDQLITSHPIADSVTDVRAALGNLDGITYQKGASVLRQLAAWVGDDAFMRGVQDYLGRYRWANADLHEFLDCLQRASGRDLTGWGKDWLQTTGLNTFRAYLVEQNGSYAAFEVEQTASPMQPTLRDHRVGVGLYDRDAEDVLTLRRRVETELTGARTPIRELVGEKVCDLVLLNDGDLTFAKLRFDGRSLETLKADLSKLADPLARALCWAAMWDLTRDGEMPTREYVELVARHSPLEGDALLLEYVTSQARIAIDLYGDPSNRTAARERLHDVADWQLRTPGLDASFRLIWARMLIATAVSARSLGEITAMVDGKLTIPGVEISADLRWLMVGQLAEEGMADASLIQATLAADPTDIGRRRAAACLAARPTLAAKEEAWERLGNLVDSTSSDSNGAPGEALSLASVAALLGGFSVGSVAVAGMMTHGPDPELLRPFVSRYLAGLRSVWTNCSFDEARLYTESLFPRYVVDDDVIAEIALAMEGETLPGPALRILREGFDDTLRSRRAREVDIAAQIRSPQEVGRGPASGRHSGRVGLG
jgi:aminopeptidase N